MLSWFKKTIECDFDKRFSHFLKAGWFTKQEYNRIKNLFYQLPKERQNSLLSWGDSD
ncbi:hypothetical protein SAMN05444274_108137 [Mariniphaga anaerophila]|uniref:Uncharacterized protein n=1 Tax=Mariniphaga anaerophila TaxID=1484053 RepID=A0A1M5E9J5_9BACT|nr:hypothetical protein SAMN05444274_108137 [Mariniphaga anaerophila]